MNIAIIGGGFSGMFAAYLLQKENIHVTVYEKEDHLGGHCKTIVSKGIYTDLGTLCSFGGKIKELLIELKIDYNEKFVYRNFVDENYNYTEHMCKENILVLIEELEILKSILENYSLFLDDIHYGFIPQDLTISLSEFLEIHNLRYISYIIAPYLSSFGFGCIDNLPAYYVFKIFNINTIYSFLYGEKVLIINNGASQVIDRLSEKISDIRYSLEVTNIENINNKVKVETEYSIDYYDKVLITTKLPNNVVKDYIYNQLMKKIDTNPFVSCCYEINNKDLSTTYYKSHLGQTNKIQFFYTYCQNNRSILVAYGYGKKTKENVSQITSDLQKLNINIKHLITVKQWFIFPHLKNHNLSNSFYQEVMNPPKTNNIHLIGSLISPNSIDSLYVSVKKSINNLIKT